MLKWTKLFYLLSVIFMISFIGCSDSTSSSPDLDPNGEEAKLALFKASEDVGDVKVMTRNIYIGADVDIVLEAETQEEIPALVAIAFEDLKSTNFPSRAAALAEEIEKTMPHMIGLQEVSTFYTQSPGDFLIGNPVQATDEYLNMLDVFMLALDARGLNYSVAVVVTNVDLELPMLTSTTPTFDDIRIVDHDVILIRNDKVTFSQPKAVVYDSMLIVDPSLGIIIPRGYVSIKATINNEDYIFVNTHLEAALDPGLTRYDQAKQLISDLSNETDPVIMVGDFNSQAPSDVTYLWVTDHGYTDAWVDNKETYNPNGYTFGHAANLKNTTVNFYERIDFVFVRSIPEPTYGESFVIGDEVRDMRSGMWPSDHGGLVTLLEF